MNRLVSLAVALCALVPLGAYAQSSASCPTLPVDAGLRWEQLDGPGFLFCKAVRDSDGGEAFAVTISRKSPFKPRRTDRAEEASIAGTPVHWYRSELAGQSVIIRETLLELGPDRVAHISLRAPDEEAKAQAMQQVQALGFQDARLSSN